MTAYWVARSKVIDASEYKKYADKVPEILEKFGGKALARGGKAEIMEGGDYYHRFVVIEFESLEKAKACFNSPEYRAAAAHRRGGAGEVEIIIVEAGEADPFALPAS